MDDGRANIDLLFRNGLKDYEVLPPQDVWDNIRPVIRNKNRPLLILRVAAVAVVVLSLGIIAYRLSIEITTGIENQLVAQSPESVAPAPILASADRPPEVAVRDNVPVNSVSQQIMDPYSPVSTDNLNTSIKEFSTLSVQTESVKSQEVSQMEYNPLAINYNPDDYFGLDIPAYLDTPDNNTRKEPGKWSISALISPTYQSRLGANSDEIYNMLIAHEEAIVSYSGGLALSYKINKRLSIQSGVYYSSLGKELSGISAYSGFGDHFYTKGSPNFEVLTTNGSVIAENNDIFLSDNMGSDRVKTAYNNDVFDPEKAALNYIDNSIHQNFSFLELPVVIRYKIIDKALDFNIIGGISSNLLVNNSVYASTENGKLQVGKTDGMNILTFSSSLGMGMEYNISNSLSLNLEPTFRYFINPFNSISYPGVHPYYFGLFSGISYKF